MLFILCIALFPYYGDSSGAILEVPSEALLHLSVVARCFEVRYKRGKRECNLNKQHFLMVGSSLVHPRFFFGSSLVFSPRNIGEVLRDEILRKSIF